MQMLAVDMLLAALLRDPDSLANRLVPEFPKDLFSKPDS
jgi:hypothetical protein